MLHQPLQGQLIAHGSEATHHPQGLVGQMGVVAEGFTGMHVAEVQLHVRDRHPQQGITDGDGRVGVSPGVDQDSAHRAAGLMDPVHQGTFVVALKAIDRGPQGAGLLPQRRIDLLEAATAVDPGLPGAEQVEVGAMEAEQLHGGG